MIESEQKYRHLFINGSDLLCIHDLEGNLLETNMPFKTEYGWRQKDLEGVNIRAMIPESYKPGFDEYIKRIIANGSDEGFLKALTRTGETVVLEYRNYLVRDESG